MPRRCRRPHASSERCPGPSCAAPSWCVVVRTPSDGDRSPARWPARSPARSGGRPVCRPSRVHARLRHQGARSAGTPAPTPAPDAEGPGPVRARPHGLLAHLGPRRPRRVRLDGRTRPRRPRTGRHPPLPAGRRPGVARLRAHRGRGTAPSPPTASTPSWTCARRTWARRPAHSRSAPDYVSSACRSATDRPPTAAGSTTSCASSRKRADRSSCTAARASAAPGR